MFLNSSTSENVYGGGVQLYFSGKPKGFVVLQNCHLSNNKASFGGGLYVNMTHISAKNRLLVQNCHFEHNMAMTGGGMFTKPRQVNLDGTKTEFDLLSFPTELFLKYTVSFHTL